MQTIKAHTNLKALSNSRQLSHTLAKRGKFVRIEIVGDIQVRDEGMFKNATPRTKYLWAPIDEVLSIKDVRRKAGRPLKVTEVQGKDVKNLAVTLS